MKIDYKKDLHPKYLLLTLSVICVILIILSVFMKNSLAPIRNAAASIINPLQKGVNEIGLWVEDKLEIFGNVKELKEENQRLKDELKVNEEKLARNEAELTELQDLRDLYNLDKMYPEYNKIAARVFSVNVSGWFAEFYIDKGLNDGVYEDCNVLSDSGLIGIVEESYADHAKVRAIIDDHSKITAEIGPKGSLCTVEGSLKTMDDGYIYAKNIDKNAGIKEGDRVITSSVSDRYLYGLTIGYVTEIKDDTNNLTKTAKITPAENFTDIKDVLVITDRKKKVSY